MFEGLAGLIPGNMIWGPAQGSGAGLPDPNALTSAGVLGDLPPLGASLAPAPGPGPFVGPMAPGPLSGGTSVPSDVAFGPAMNPPVLVPPDAGVRPPGSEPVSLAPPSPGPAVAAPAAVPPPTPQQDTAAKLLGALRGVTAPAAPVAQKVSTPGSGLGHAPAVTPAHPQASKLLAILEAMGLGRQAVAPVRPPQSLGQVLGGR